MGRAADPAGRDARRPAGQRRGLARAAAGPGRALVDSRRGVPPFQHAVWRRPARSTRCGFDPNMVAVKGAIAPVKERLFLARQCESRAGARPRPSSAPRSMEQILDAAEYLFSRHGMHGVTLKDVAKRVGVHHTLLNYYFEDKKKLFAPSRAAAPRVTVERRMKALDEYDAATKGKPTVEGALRAFLDTDLDLYIAGRRGLDELCRARRPDVQLGRRRRRADEQLFRSGRASADRAAAQGAARLPGRGSVLGLSFRDRRADADARPHRAHRQAVGRPVQVGRFRPRSSSAWRASWRRASSRFAAGSARPRKAEPSPALPVRPPAGLHDPGRRRWK